MTPDAALDALETHVRDRHHEAALEGVARMAWALERGATFEDEVAPVRLAAATAQLFTDPTLRISEEGFARLVGLNRVWAGVFAAGGFGTAAPALAALPSVKKVARSPRWMLWSPETFDDAALRALEKMSPTEALPIAAALLSHRIVATPRAEAARSRLIERSGRLARARLDPGHLDVIAAAWMTCSYARTPKKHDLKSNLAPVFARYLAERGVPDVPPPRPERERPVLAVLSERFEHGHAMFRCYAPSIRQLRRDFRVVLFSEPHAVDPHAIDVVDEVVMFEFDPRDPAAIAERIRAYAPDVVYYPSLGMAHWTVLLSSVRLAPVQVLGLGHPASSRSPAIDYVVTEEGHSGDPDDYTETIVTMRRGGHPFERVETSISAVAPRERADPFRIAVPANAAKLSAQLLQSCRAIRDRATRPVELHFFPNLRGLYAAQARAVIEDVLPGAFVHDPMPYEDYVATLAKCDLHLSPFPFGGTNSNVDTLRLGIPMLSLAGPFSASAGEHEMLERIGLADALVAANVADYEARALRIVEDDVYRIELARRVAAADPEAAFCGGHDEASPTEFADTIRWIHAHHEMLRADGRRVWRFGYDAHPCE